jgi:hypothetical protein
MLLATASDCTLGTYPVVRTLFFGPDDALFLSTAAIGIVITVATVEDCPSREYRFGEPSSKVTENATLGQEDSCVKLGGAS